MQAGVAALAAGLLIYGWRRNVWTATFLSFFLSAFTLLLKPVGVFLIAGHCLAGAGLLIWTYLREPSRNFRRFAWAWVLGIGWCALICGWCYFSPYFSAANQEMGRQALEQLKSMSTMGIARQTFMEIIPSLGVYALGFFTIGLWIAALVCFQKISKQIAWGRFVALLAGVVLVLHLAVLYHGTRFQTSRYFLPALAIFWIFLSPFLWFLLEKFLWARLAVLANAFILTASVWSADFAKAANQVSGYPTFLSQSAIQTAHLAKKSVECSPSYQREPIVYVLSNNPSSHIVAHQLAEEGGWEEKVVWKYSPRVWEKHTPTIHPHEIAGSDFLVIRIGENKSRKSLKSLEGPQAVSNFFQTSEVHGISRILAKEKSLTVRKISDQLAFEKMLAVHLAKAGLLHPAETGAILETASGTAPIAKFESGDELVSADAEWVGEKLRIMATWSGSRDLKRHLQASLALVDSRGVSIHWIPLSLVAPPASGDGLRYRRTIVDDLDCGPFAKRTSKVALGIYDLSNKRMVRPSTSREPIIDDRIPLPIAGGFENQGSKQP